MYMGNLTEKELTILTKLRYNVWAMVEWLKIGKISKEDIQPIIKSFEDYETESKKLDVNFKNCLYSINQKLIEKINKRETPPAQKGDVFHTKKYGKIMITLVVPDREEISFCNEDGDLKTFKFEDFEKLEMIK